MHTDLHSIESQEQNCACLKSPTDTGQHRRKPAPISAVRKYNGDYSWKGIGQKAGDETVQLTINRVSNTTELQHYYNKLHKREGTAVLKKTST